MTINKCDLFLNRLNRSCLFVWKKVVILTVLKTDTGDLAECAKVTREMIFKELGKITL